MKQLSSVRFLLLFTLGCLGFSTPVFTQKQLELVSHLDYVSDANDIWGYTAPDGTEYALVGLHNGVSVVSLADPANPVEIQHIPGDESVWRDLKTWGHFAYVTTDQPGSNEGLLIIDLSGLPNGVTWANWKPVLPGTTDSLYTCHNLWIDEDGYCYLSGCDQNSGGPIILDVFSTPGQPQFVGYTPPVYAHDCFTQNDLLYTAEIYEGQFRVFDVTDKQAPVLLATQQTPFQFCHNVWANADGSVLFTTDERANAPTAAYDLTDLDDIRLLDEYRPVATLGDGVIPHNAHVLGNYVIISNYTDGVRVVDAAQPDNLIEVEYYDTNTDFDNGFHGCWGAYPYFPSGLIAATDIENGLFILKPNYPKATYLQGKVTDGTTGLPITGAVVVVQSPDANLATTSFTGEYKTGQATTGMFPVFIQAKGYFDMLLSVVLEEGEVTTLDVQMVPLPARQLTIKVLEEDSGKPIPDAEVLLENKDFSYTGKTNASGTCILSGVLIGQYAIYAGKWGYANLADSISLQLDASHEYKLTTAYADNFNNDLGWQVSGNATNGNWERGKPKGVRAANRQFAPDGDSPNDPGNHAYVTGNTGEQVQDDQVDAGETILSSPPMLLRSRYNRPMLRFDYWWLDAISNNAANDSLVISISNGQTTAVLKTISTDQANVQVWTSADTFDLANYLPITDQMRLTLTATDRSVTPNVVEAGLDNFRVWDALPDDLLNVQDELAQFRLFPNPAANDLTVDFYIKKDFRQAKFLLFNNLGQLVLENGLQDKRGHLQLDLRNLPPSTYFACIRVDGKLSKTAKLVKVGK